MPNPSYNDPARHGDVEAGFSRMADLLMERARKTSVAAEIAAAIEGLASDVVFKEKIAANPVDYKLVIDVDDTASFQRALDANKTVMILNGSYTISGLITMLGDRCLYGQSITGVLITVNTPSFLRVIGGPNYARASVYQMTIMPAQTPTSGSYGIKHDIANFSPLRNSLALKDIVFRGSDGVIQSARRFERYIWTVNTYGGEARNVRIEGGYRVTENPSEQFVCTGANISGQSVGFLLDHCNFNAVHSGVVSDGISEGTQCVACEMVGVRDAYVGTSTQPGMWLTSCHGNSSRYGLRSAGRAQINAANCTFYRTGTFFSEPWAGVSLTNTVGAELTGTEVVDSLGGNGTGIEIGVSCQSVNVSGLTLRTVNVGITHGGSNAGCHYDGVTFNTVATGFVTTGSDSEIHLGQHSFIGSNTTRYSIASQKNSITIDTGRPRYNRLVGQATVSAAGSKTLVTTIDQQVQRFSFANPGSAFTYDVILSNTNALLGDFWEFWFNLPSSTNVTVRVLRADGTTVLATLNTATSKRYAGTAVFDGSQWAIQRLNENLV